MLNPGLPETLWSRLDGRLWHATSCTRLKGIISDRELRVGVGNRYTNSFCRYYGGVCLFDFGPTAENIGIQFTNVSGWFDHQLGGDRVAIWLEIDRKKSIEHLWDAGKARQKWHETSYVGQIIPGFEACHIGPISLASVVSALLIDRHDRKLFHTCNKVDGNIFQQIEEFERELPPPPPPNPLAALIEESFRIKRGDPP